MARWFVSSDACGLFSANFTTVLILYAQFVFCKVIVLPWYGFSWHLVLYTCISLLSLTSHTRAQFTNPGAVPKSHSSPHYPGPIPIDTPIDHDTPGIDPTKPIARICRHCKCVKPYRAHHCSSCARCVIRMDHHCPWVNNCVAIFNQKYFLLFLLYTGLCCVYCAAMLIGRFISCTNNLRQCSVTGVQAVLCVINFVEALIFGLFVSVMMWDQMGAIFDNTPYIDSLKKVKGVRRGKYQSLKEVFGEPFSWRWFLPLATAAGLKDAFDFEVSRDELVLPPKSKLPAAAAAAAPGAAAAAAGAAGAASPTATGSANAKPLNAADAATDAVLNGLHQRGAAANTNSAERSALLDGATR